MRHLWVGMAAAVLLGVLLASPASAAGERRAWVAQVKGSVEIQRQGMGPWFLVAEREKRWVQTNDHVRTKARSEATLYIDSARVSLRENTHVAIPPPSRDGGRGLLSRLRLMAGRLWVWLLGSPRMEIVTAGAVAAAEGTQFEVTATDDGATTLVVWEGLVAFYNNLGNVRVGANQTSSATATSAPTRPMAVDPSGYLQWEATLGALRPGLEFRYFPGSTQAQLRSDLAIAEMAPLRRADTLQDVGELQAAEAAYRQVLEAAPADQTVLLRLGVNLLLQAQVAPAREAFLSVTDPGLQSDAKAGLAMAEMLTGTDAGLAAAQAAVADALAAQADNPRAHLTAGLIAMRQGDAGVAEAAFEQAIAALPEGYQSHAYLSQVLLTEGRVPEAQAAAEKALANAPDSALARETAATVAFYTGDLAGCREHLDAALDINAESATAHLLNSNLLAAEGDVRSALKEAQLAVAFDPSLGAAYSAQGMLWLAESDVAAAEVAFEKALKASPTLAAAHTGLGLTYARQGETAQALEMQKAALALDPTAASVHNNLGAVYLAQGRLGEAVAMFEQAAEAQPKWGLPHGNLAIAYLDLNQFAAASREAELAVKLGDRSARSYTTLGRVLLEQNRVTKAFAALRRAVELDEDYALARFQLAEVYRRQGRDRDAVAEQLQGIARQPSAMLESREYARTEVRLEAGSLAGNLRTDGRGDDGRNAYYLNLGHSEDDWDRAHSDFESTSVLAVAGRQDDADTTQAFRFYGERTDRDRPGQLLANGTREDADFTEDFEGYGGDYLTRRGLSDSADLTLRVGYETASLENDNPDSLNPDPKPYRHLDATRNSLTAEARLDWRICRDKRLIAGIAGSDEQEKVSGLLSSTGPAGVVTTPFRNRANTDAGTAYGEYTQALGDRTEIMVGGRVASRAETEATWRPKARLTHSAGAGAQVVLLTRPILADDVSRLAPVEPWALHGSLSPEALARGGYCQSHELQYQLMPADGSLLRLTAFRRDLSNYLADLADPSWAAGAVRAAISSGALTGAELEWEKWLGANLSAGVWVRYTDSENDDTGLEIPYEPEITGALSINYLDSHGWRIGADWSYVGSRYADLANATKLGSFNTLNLRAARQLSLQTDVFVTVENLLDEEDGIWQGYPSRGRNVKAGVEYRF